MIIHGGLERAASTFLQEKVFPFLDTYRYDADAAPALRALGRDSVAHLDAAVRDRFATVYNTKVLLSSEQFWCRYHHFLGRPPYSSELALTNILALASPPVKLLMILRRQDDAIDSIVRYKQRFLSKPNMLIADYPVKPNFFGVYRIASQYGRLLRTYDYYMAMSLAANILGKENVTIAVYEDLAHDPGAFFDRLSESFEEDMSRFVACAETRVNSESAKYENLVDGYVPMGHIMRKVNNLTGCRLEKLLPKRPSALTDRQRAELMAVFREGNRKLADFFDIDLGKYGYC